MAELNRERNKIYTAPVREPQGILRIQSHTSSISSISLGYPICSKKQYSRFLNGQSIR